MALQTAPTVRQARPDDAPELTGLLVQLGYPDNDVERVRRRLATWTEDTSSRALVAEHEGRLVGAIAVTAVPFFERDGKWARIVALVVADGQRGKGIGRLLMAAAERFAAKLGCARTEVTSSRGRTESHPFYRRLGFVDSTDRSVRYLKDLG